MGVIQGRNALYSLRAQRHSHHTRSTGGRHHPAHARCHQAPSDASASLRLRGYPLRCTAVVQVVLGLAEGFHDASPERQ